jgi:hypothetical protein
MCICACGSSDGPDQIECEYGAPFVSQFEKQCQQASDCVRVSSGYDCCGTTLYAGIHTSEETRFNEAWSECSAKLEQCECAVQPPHAEDGNSTTNYTNIQVDCLQGSCTSFVN